jgi:osmoprotectant transport system permease protein
MSPPGGFTFHKTGNPWFSWHYVTSHGHDILTATQQHVTLTLEAVLLGAALSVPMAILARRKPWLRSGVLGFATAVYAIPSLAFIVALGPVFNYNRLTVVVPLAGYSLVIFVRNILTGLDEVDREAIEAARGMGFSDRRIFLRVRLPMAAPAIVAGLRLAVVSTIELVVIGGYVAQGGYGEQIFQGLHDNLYKQQITTYLILTVLLALVADGLILLLGRAITPWRRGLAAS